LQRDIEINEDFTDIEDEQDLDDVFLETCVICEEVMPMDVLEKTRTEVSREENRWDRSTFMLTRKH
jgi:hypothetical protein